MKRETYIAVLANEMLKAAAEEVAEMPFSKTASENDINEVLAEKIASVYDNACEIYKQAEETISKADTQEESARKVLEANGIDPDAVISAASDAAAAEMHHEKEDEDEDEDEEEDEDKDEDEDEDEEEDDEDDKD